MRASIDLLNEERLVSKDGKAPHFNLDRRGSSSLKLFDGRSKNSNTNKNRLVSLTLNLVRMSKVQMRRVGTARLFAFAKASKYLCCQQVVQRSFEIGMRIAFRSEQASLNESNRVGKSKRYGAREKVARAENGF
jgi:hypothetical protein